MSDRENMSDREKELLRAIGESTVMALFRYEELLLSLASGIKDEGDLYSRIRDAYREDSLVAVLLLHTLEKMGPNVTEDSFDAVFQKEDNPFLLLDLLRLLAYSLSAFALANSEEDIRPELLLSQEGIESLMGPEQMAFLKKWGEDKQSE